MRRYLAVCPLLIIIGLPILIVLRPIKTLSTDLAVDLDGLALPFLDNSPNDLEIVFFGYVGCESVCPSSLAKLAQFLESEAIAASSLNIGAVFINIRGDGSGPPAEHYSQLYSERIRGWDPSSMELAQLRRPFNLQIRHSLRNPNDIAHTDHFFVLTHRSGGWHHHKSLPNQSDLSELKTHILSKL